MSTAQEGSSGVSRRCKKTDKGRHIWTTKEEEVLMAAMKEMVVHGWKSDNGFRAGYLTRLEDAMKKAFPNTDLKGSPNINSKLATWKKNYYSLTSILNRSGIGWNLNGDYMIECTNDQWDQICKVDNNTRTMRYKPWPFYDDWTYIFGKDRANGENAEDIGDALYNVMREETVPDDANGGSYHVHMDEVFPNEIPDERFSQSGKVTASPKKAGKKRKERDDN